MTKRDFACAGCKLMALYLAASLLSSQQLFMFWLFLRSGHPPMDPFGWGQYVFTTTQPFILQIVVACILWFAADSLARRIAPEEPEKT